MTTVTSTSTPRQRNAGTSARPSTPWRVPVRGRAHGYASRKCPHWIGGRCKRGELPGDGKRRRERPLSGWAAASAGCEWFENNLLPGAPRTVRKDYAWRVSPALPESDSTERSGASIAPSKIVA